MVDPSRVSILLGTPVAQSGVTPAYLQSVLAFSQLCADLGWLVDIRTREDGLVTRSRNIFGSQMVHSERYTHLLMVDSDLGFEPEVPQRLVDSGHDLVGACVPLREVRWQNVRAALDQVGSLTPEEMESLGHLYAVSFVRPSSDAGGVTPVGDFVPARFVGGAMMLARREVFVRLAGSDEVTHYEQGGNWQDWDPSGWTFFDQLVDPETGTYLSEDYAFCHRWRAVGGTLWADVRSQVTHNGNLAVHGDVAQTLRTAGKVAKARHNAADSQSRVTISD